MREDRAEEVSEIAGEPSQSSQCALAYRKSNSMINAKGRCSALGLKIFAVGILNATTGPDGTITARISGQKLRALFHNNSGSFYTQISELIRPSDESKPSLLDWRIYVEDPRRNELEGINVITNARFRDGELMLRFNPDIRDDIYSLKGNYGTMNLETTIGMERAYSIRFYEIFKSYMDKEKALTKREGPYTLVYGYGELRQTLGIDPPSGVNTKEKPEYPTYGGFRRYVLEKSRKELELKSGIHMDYEAIRSGRGGRVTAIRFVLSQNTTTQTRKNGSCLKETADTKSGEADEAEEAKEIDDNKLETLAHVRYILKAERLDQSEVKAICEAAGYDITRIELAYSLERKANNVGSFTGWMISAIRRNYRASERRSMPREYRACRERKSHFNDFDQQDYDFEELEKLALERD